METSAAAFTSSSTSSGRIADRSTFSAFKRVPENIIEKTEWVLLHAWSSTPLHNTKQHLSTFIYENDTFWRENYAAQSILHFLTCISLSHCQLIQVQKNAKIVLPQSSQDAWYATSLTVYQSTYSLMTESGQNYFKNKITSWRFCEVKIDGTLASSTITSWKSRANNLIVLVECWLNIVQRVISNHFSM